jgi:glycosyltransferase involved in cell wall biosynthesis
MIYYDITDLLDHFRRCLRVGGIARVSTVTIAHFGEIAPKGEYRLIAWHPGLKRTVVADPATFPRNTVSGPDFSAYFGLRFKGPHPLDAYVTSRYRSRVSRFLHKVRLSVANALTQGETYRRKGLGGLSAGGKSVVKAAWRVPEFMPGDIVLISGGTRGNWKFLSFLEKERKEKGIRLAQTLYDVVPLSDPAFYLQGHPYLFADWLTRINRFVDLVIACSDQTARDFVGEIERRGEKPAPVRVVTLAHEFLENAPAPANVPTPVYEQISTPVLLAARLPYVLCVGTREIRKNHLGLARVWERLRQKNDLKLPRLIFAGRPGWMNEEFDRFLRRTQNVGDSIQLVENPTDDELAYLYKNCLFTVFPSFCEGWGLPVGESLWFGRPVITSNCSSMPEVGGDYADYADPYDLESLLAAVERMCDPAYRESRTSAIGKLRKRDWRTYSVDLWRNLQSAGE